MRCLVPDFILRKAREKDFKGSFDAYVLNVDLKGFAQLTHTLMKQSEESTEVLINVINAIFTPSIEAIRKRGGFIAVFAGDSFTAVFLNNGADRPLNAALSIRDFFLKSGLQKTEFGDFEVSASIGLAKGKVRWNIIPAKEKFAYWFCGDGFNRAVEARKRSAENQVVIEQNILSAVDKKNITTAKIDKRYNILEKSELPETLADKSLSCLSQKLFIPKQILDLKIDGEFRDVLSCFINLAVPNDKQIGRIINLCEKYGGYFNNIECSDKGWIALVLFGAPVAYEKRATRAVDFAIELQSLCKKNVRVGLSYGKSFTGFIGSRRRGDYTAIGMAVNLAYRYMQRAGWGDVWADNYIRTETSNGITYENLGWVEFKGFPKPIKTFRLLPKVEWQSASGYRTEFIGRITELNKLAETCEVLWQGKFAGVTYLYGEAGQGKSRLSYELQKKMGDKAQCFTLKTDSIHRQPLNPFSHWIRQLLTTKMTGSITERRKDFRHNWAEFKKRMKQLKIPNTKLLEIDRIESILAGLIGLEWEGSIYANLDPRYRPAVKGFALKSLLEIFCSVKPVILVIEDLHWLDQESANTLQILTRRAAAIPFKLILNSRVLDDGTNPQIKLDPDVLTETIQLVGLDQTQAQDLMVSILKKDLASDIVDYVYSISQGNPFIVEQLTQYLQETEKFEVRDNIYYLKDQTAELPKEVQAVIVARLDRLDAELKQTVQTASVLGLEFAVAVLCKMIETMEHRPDDMNELIVKSQLHYGEQEHIWYALSEIKYIFSHALLRETVYNMQLKKQLKKLHRLAGEIMEKLYPEDRTKYAEIAEHYSKADIWAKAIDYHEKTGNYEMEKNHLATSIDYYQSALKIAQEHLGDRYTEIVRIYNYLGLAYYTLTNYNQSLVNYEQALSIQLENYGEQNEDTAWILFGIGSVYSSKAEYEKALHFLEKSLAIRKDILGDRHPDVAESLNGIGVVYRDKSEYDQAMNCFEDALDIRQEFDGEQSSDTASVYQNIGLIYAFKGEFEQALSHYEKALSIWKETSGEKSKDTSIAYCSIGNVYSDTGKYDQALSYLAKSESILKDLFGERHEDYAKTIHNIGAVYLQKGDFDTALRYFEQSLNIDKEILGDRHPDIAKSLNNISIYYAEKGDDKEAIKYMEQALSIQREALGERNRETARTHHNIGHIYYGLGEIEKAIDSFKLSLSISEEVFGDKHIMTASCMRSIGRAYIDKGLYDEALVSLEKALQIDKELFGEQHINTAADHAIFSLALNRKKDYDRAVMNGEKALAIMRLVVGDKHPHTAACLAALGEAHLAQGNLKTALKYYEQEYVIQKEIMGENHPDTIMTHFNIGDVYYSMCNFDRALEYHLQALTPIKKILGERHPTTGCCFYAIGNDYFDKKDYLKAVEHYEQAFSINNEVFGLKHPDTIKICKNMASAYEKMGNEVKAAEYRAMLD
ncbi:MAG: tetratricopeptide repeat protein [Candidatus Cloacimonetes bacterium]|nr:tetratricopeptide repeat protein [Candidatus Cloacimonadota bacterium]